MPHRMRPLLKASMNPKITLAWITRRGANSITEIQAEEVEPRIKRFFKQRIEAVAWVGGNRTDVVAAVTPPHGGKLEASPHAFWSWWMEMPPYVR
jgi:hypothetical protein